MKDGHIEQTGTYDELKHSNETFRQMTSGDGNSSSSFASAGFLKLSPAIKRAFSQMPNQNSPITELRYSVISVLKIIPFLLPILVEKD